MPQSTDFVRNFEVRYASSYFIEFGKICKELGFEFRGRNSTKNNSKSPDICNALMNYSYALLAAYVRRGINSIGLENSIWYLHDLSNARSLQFDLMELWRVSADYSVIQTLQSLRTRGKNYFLGNDYTAFLTQDTIRLLYEFVRSNLTLEEILLNIRIFAGFLVGKTENLFFALKPIQVKTIFERQRVKQNILTKSYKELGMNKSSLWYMKKRLEQTGSIRVYNKSKQHFV